MNILIITYATLGAVLVFLCRAERRRFEREAARDRDHQDRLGALIRDARDWPHESYAWGPDADQPIPYTVELDKADEALWEAELAEGSER